MVLLIVHIQCTLEVVKMQYSNAHKFENTRASEALLSWPNVFIYVIEFQTKEEEAAAAMKVGAVRREMKLRHLQLWPMLHQRMAWFMVTKHFVRAIDSSKGSYS